MLYNGPIVNEATGELKMTHTHEQLLRQLRDLVDEWDDYQEWAVVEAGHTPAKGAEDGYALVASRLRKLVEQAPSC